MASPPATAAKPADPPKIHIQPVQVNTSSPRFPPPPVTPNSIYAASSPSLRRIAIAVDLSDESAFAVKWAAENYIRPGDTVILLHVRSTSVLYGADWGSSTPTTAGAGGGSSNPFTKSPPAPGAAASPRQMEEEYDQLTAKKASNLAQPLVEAHVPVKIHIVKDHDMKERLCLEVERLALSAVIMGSRGIGATARGRSKGKLGSVSDYCVQHCACPVVVVRYKQDDDDAAPGEKERERERGERDDEFHDANDQLTK
ncbi:universal stress protein PHOS34-like [Salvia miltiorrhiza]|uniref:universal stress protein PHOS34-like n=1 Tax=Salvia miltiorrhiza TaxID=226208 RepID=UPI0025AC42CF|nr:universal stress protein PHOS34-like [Salvia miltiorrhiza]